VDATNSYARTYDHDAYGRLTTTTTWQHDEATYAATDTWSDTIFHAVTSAYDSGADDTIDLRYDWVCTDAFPWVCDAEIDGSEGDGTDGETDATAAEDWSCP
jgi:hypothetical protein